MAKKIRLKKENVFQIQCEKESPYSCYSYFTGETIEVPIREWAFNPENINMSYTQGGNIPEVSVSITFPEFTLIIGENYKNVHYSVQVFYQGNASNWLNIIGTNLQGNEFTAANLDNETIRLHLVNLSLLPEGVHTATFMVKAYEVSGTEKTFIENSPVVNVVLNVKDNGLPTNPDYRVRHITYNRSKGQLSGDLPIVINEVSSFNEVDTIPYFYECNLTKTLTQSSIELVPKSELNLLIPGQYTQSLRLIKKETRAFGISSTRVVRDIPLILNVIENSSTPAAFSLAPTDFNFIASKTSNEVREASASIYNPENLNIQVVLAPSFLENVRIENEQLKFHTKGASSLNVGVYEGEIVLRSGSIERRVSVVLKVVQSLENDFKGEHYFFALDKRKVSITRTNPLASYVTMRLEMYYKGYGEEYRENQEYSQHYFQNKIDFYPGEEVQDFFIKCKNLEPLELSQYQYSLAVVNIIIKEFNEQDVELSESRLDNVFFAPGKKPKCFPIFTDFALRRTFSGSKIRLNTDVLSEKITLNTLFEKYTQTKPSIPQKYEVYAFNFNRGNFQASEEKMLLTAGKLKFIPFPEPKAKKLAHIFFENQNLVLDWFSCPLWHQRKFDFNHIIDENTGEKFAALETETLVMNTGWILREEIELINALIKSRICFIVMGNHIIKARPISKKNEIFDSQENLFSMDLEFNIKQNER